MVAGGFETLATMRIWYQASLGALVASSVGIRSLTKFFGQNANLGDFLGGQKIVVTFW